MSISDGTDTPQRTTTTAPTYRQLGEMIGHRIAREMPSFAAKFPPAELANAMTTALGQATGAATLTTPRPQCTAHGWCTKTGGHTWHESAYVEAPGLDGYDEHPLPANIMAETGQPGLAPFVGFLDLDLTPDETRARCAELRAHLENVEALADQIEGQAPLEPAAECYSVTAPGASGALLSAEIFRSDDEENPRTAIAVWSQPRADDDLDVAGADQLLADLEQFIPRLRALRNHLASVTTAAAGKEVRP